MENNVILQENAAPETVTTTSQAGATTIIMADLLGEDAAAEAQDACLTIKPL